jgi:hypothetical protein
MLLRQRRLFFLLQPGFQLRGVAAFVRGRLSRGLPMRRPSFFSHWVSKGDLLRSGFRLISKKITIDWPLVARIPQWRSA